MKNTTLSHIGSVIVGITIGITAYYVSKRYRVIVSRKSNEEDKQPEEEPKDKPIKEANEVKHPEEPKEPKEPEESEESEESTDTEESEDGSLDSDIKKDMLHNSGSVSRQIFCADCNLYNALWCDFRCMK